MEARSRTDSSQCGEGGEISEGMGKRWDRTYRTAAGKLRRRSWLLPVVQGTTTGRLAEIGGLVSAAPARRHPQRSFADLL